MKFKIKSFFKELIHLLVLILFLSCSGEKKNNETDLLPLLLLTQTSSTSSATGTCPPSSLPSDIPIATTVVSANSTVSGFNDPTKAINGICGGGETSGSLDVYSLNLTGAGATMILSWGGKTVKNVSGTDFIVYENPFKISDTSDRYAFDPMVVQVSFDGSIYCGFNLSGFGGGLPSSDNNKIAYWPGFGGLRPVIYNMTSKLFTLDQLFTASGSGFLTGGGDGFNLDDLSDSDTVNPACNNTAKTNIQTNGFKYIKMISATAVTNPATSAGYVYPHAYTNGPDIDGVVAKSVE
ncbi:LIC_13355 family lipoprotein [Leptospira ilyithenensis]|uniref:LIC_13355 family lipoprotein n=1 Tax=Leptospira ilyithenensis TaxID=2484901 RepID=A0A4R9LT37_9LEPT|nr:LIC_13355 family lipoprotein [Leptospira ilyithenensis]TGN13149.1 LIC_13355 family lipoprotein [Leptospira ilyithenensis]